MDENKEVNSTDPKREKVRVIPLSAIDDAPDHPFGVRDDDEMAELVESISTFGVNNPEKNNTLGKGGQENEHGSNVPVQSTRGSDDSRSEAAHRDQLSSRQIRNDAARISKEASEGNVHDASHASEAERASARSGGSGERTDIDDYMVQ